MVGIASQNENSAAERRSAPNSIAPTMVAPARDTPGIIDTHLEQADAEIHPATEIRWRRNASPAQLSRSTHSSTKPPRISMTQTIHTSNSTALMKP